MSQHLRRGAVVALIAAGTSAGLAAPAHAADTAYRYWGYSHLTGGKWVTATTGPAQASPADGAVEGWRFALVAGLTPRLPRDVVTFSEACGSTAAQAGKKRVGVVIDPGRSVDAPSGATAPQPSVKCVTVPTAATGEQVLTAAAKVREQKSMVCGIDGYPASGCSDTVPAARVGAAAKAADTAVDIPVAAASASPSATSTDDSSGSSNAPKIIGGVAVVAVLGALLAVILRQRGRRDGR